MSYFTDHKHALNYAHYASCTLADHLKQMNDSLPYNFTQVKEELTCIVQDLKTVSAKILNVRDVFTDTPPTLEVQHHITQQFSVQPYPFTFMYTLNPSCVLGSPYATQVDAIQPAAPLTAMQPVTPVDAMQPAAPHAAVQPAAPLTAMQPVMQPATDITVTTSSVAAEDCLTPNQHEATIKDVPDNVKRRIDEALSEVRPYLKKNKHEDQQVQFMYDRPEKHADRFNCIHPFIREFLYNRKTSLRFFAVVCRDSYSPANIKNIFINVCSGLSLYELQKHYDKGFLRNQLIMYIKDLMVIKDNEGVVYIHVNLYNNSLKIILKQFRK